MEEEKAPPATQRSIKIRLYPTNERIVLFEKTFGCCRFIWNKMLADEEALYKENKSHHINTPAAYKTNYPFLKEVDCVALANVQLDLADAFSRVFKNPEKVEHPSFKSKKKSKYKLEDQGKHLIVIDQWFPVRLVTSAAT